MMNRTGEDLRVIDNSPVYKLVTIEELEWMYNDLCRPLANVIIIESDAYVVFFHRPETQYVIKGCNDLAKLSFIDNHYKSIDVTKKVKRFFPFLLYELTQGNTLPQRILRIGETLLPLIIVNSLLYFYSTNSHVYHFMKGLLAALSIFIAIFSLFLISYDYFGRKLRYSFEIGKLAYYFSVDLNLTKSGIYAIIISLLSLLLLDNDSKLFWTGICLLNIKTLLSLFMVNIAFLFTWITLRSIIEFYVPRPAKFTLGKLKDDILHDFGKPSNVDNRD